MVTGAQGKNNILAQKPLSTAEKSPAKKADRSFEKELEKTQKKMPKRKEDEVAAQDSSSRASQQTPIKKDSEKSEQKSVAQVSGSRGKKSEKLEAGKVAINNGIPQEMVEDQIPTQEEIISQSTPTKDLLDLNVTQSEIMNIENLSLENTEGIDISQMEAINPQEASEFTDLLKLNSAMGAQPSVAMESLDTSAPVLSQESSFGAVEVGALDSTIGKKEDNLNDSSSEDKNMAESLADTKIDNMGVHSKEKVNDSFAKLLDAKALGMTPVQQKENSDALVTNVRTMIRDGGGEMVMKLTPEGMGNIDLKVGVKDGIVNIEMKADNADAKRALESNMSDMRMALEGQNLKIETVKVDVADSFKDMQRDLQNQQNMMEQNFARNFLGQNRDERQSLRQSALGMDLERFPTSANGPHGLQPAQSRTTGIGRLNVVA